MSLGAGFHSMPRINRLLVHSVWWQLNTHKVRNPPYPPLFGVFLSTLPPPSPPRTPPIGPQGEAKKRNPALLDLAVLQLAREEIVPLITLPPPTTVDVNISRVQGEAVVERGDARTSDGEEETGQRLVHRLHLT
jgi:hypothetical protein